MRDHRRGRIVIDENDPGWGPELIDYISPTQVGKGYASEVAKFACHFAFNSAKLESICAFAHPENIASNRILKKVGFQKIN
ncbi:GNAT family N-acetyltransferase [Gynuella sp.]|uniref:GNAT family N-acetyltransferase n=1 Tax=Gynuella sp. TaxID=2969146 RepID=UPI003D0EFD43